MCFNDNSEVAYFLLGHPTVWHALCWCLGYWRSNVFQSLHNFDIFAVLRSRRYLHV